MVVVEGLYDGGNGVFFIIVGDLKIFKMFFIFVIYDIDGYVLGINNLLEGGYQMFDGIMVLLVEEKIKCGQIVIVVLDVFCKVYKVGDEVSVVVVCKILDENVKYFGYGYIKDFVYLVFNVGFIFWLFWIMVGLGGYFILFFIIVLIVLKKEKLVDM